MNMSSSSRLAHKVVLPLMVLALLAPFLVAAALPQPARAAVGVTAFAKPETGYTFTPWIRDYKVIVYLTGFTYRHVYQLKIRDVTKGAGPWYKLDTLHIRKGRTIYQGYYLPKALTYSRYLQICLKDQTSDRLICRTVLNPGS